MTYLTLEETIRQNGHRHLERAISYASAGYPNRFYEGSMRKALKNFKRADSFTEVDKLCQLFWKQMADDLYNRIVDNIINGSHYWIDWDGVITPIAAKDIYK